MSQDLDIKVKLSFLSQRERNPFLKEITGDEGIVERLHKEQEIRQLIKETERVTFGEDIGVYKQLSLVRQDGSGELLVALLKTEIMNRPMLAEYIHKLCVSQFSKKLCELLSANPIISTSTATQTMTCFPPLDSTKF